MIIFEYIILTAMIVCSIAASCTKNLLSSVIIFMTYSLMACIIWVCLRSPDLAVTEAAVGAGVSSTLFFVTLKNVNKLTEEGEDEDGE